MMESLMALPSKPDLRPAAAPHLYIDRWLELWNEKWSVTPEHVRFTAGNSELPCVEVAYYLDRQGRVCKPSFVPGPYLPVVFHSTPTESRSRLDRQWLTVGQLLAEDMRARGLKGRIALPPDITDVRPWLAAGFRVEVQYTYCVDLPYDDSLMRPTIRRSIARSVRDGFTCARASSFEDVYDCMAETEQRQGFSHEVSVDDLKLAQRVLGPDIFRVYAAYAPNGEIASTTIELHKPGGRAVGWIAATKSEYLRSGAAQLLNAYILEDLAADGAAGYDFAGANLPSVAASKAQWGATLKPFYRIESGGPGDLVRHVRNYWQFRRGRS